MISKKEESYGKAAFDASQSSFEDAKRMLYQYQNKDIPMFVSMDEPNSGFLDMNKVIQEIQHKFYVQLRDTQETIALGREEIEALKNDKSYQKSGRTIQENLKKHSNNLQNIAKASADNSKTSAPPRGARTAAVPTPSQKIMDAYAAGGGNKKDFYSYLQNKSKQEAVTVDSLIAYEENRRKELTQKSENRIQKMKEFAAAQNIAETDKTKGSVLLKKYRELGGKAVNKALFTDISSLLQYEQSRLLENRSQWFSGAAAQYHERKERIDELAKNSLILYKMVRMLPMQISLGTTRKPLVRVSFSTDWTFIPIENAYWLMNAGLSKINSVVIKKAGLQCKIERNFENCFLRNPEMPMRYRSGRKRFKVKSSSREKKEST